MKPYLLADDLSGALEAGAAFRQRGWRVTLPLRGHDAKRAGGPDELQVISTETRNAADGEAERSLRAVLDTQKAAGATLLFKKIDSTLRGPVGAELAAVADVLVPSMILLCPSNPLAGRTVIDGRLLVGGVPLEQTDFRRDPIWPARTSDIRALLARNEGEEICAMTLEQLRTGPDVALSALARKGLVTGTRLAVVDAVSMNDLRLLVDSVERVLPTALLVGSGALSHVLAERRVGRSNIPEATVEPVPSVLVLCGSRHPSSRRQLAHLAEVGSAVVLSMHLGDDPDVVGKRLIDAFRSTRVVALQVCGEMAPGHSLAAPVEALAGIAVSLTRVCTIGALYLTGGETARGVCVALDGERLEILRELEPGVVVSRLDRRDAASMVVVTKPGGFGEIASLERHLRDILGPKGRS